VADVSLPGGVLWVESETPMGRRFVVRYATATRVRWLLLVGVPFVALPLALLVALVSVSIRRASGGPVLGILGLVFFIAIPAAIVVRMILAWNDATRIDVDAQQVVVSRLGRRRWRRSLPTVAVEAFVEEVVERRRSGRDSSDGESVIVVRGAEGTFKIEGTELLPQTVRFMLERLNLALAEARRRAGVA